MVHLVIHLATEAKIGGPVAYRSMWFVERYLGVLKSYVRNKAHPAGSTAEACLADECMTFCSLYIEGFETKHNRPSRNDEDEVADVEQGPTLFPHVCKPLGKPELMLMRSLASVTSPQIPLSQCNMKTSTTGSKLI
ncbi:uncharacterized protein LOC112270533 isoform X1 [Brachypodium distachyon]|uniref:uncharacterized protein LOC112270533 isoform X1 n=2 Tax=Brachypodium distachyon TaxID=15368 RepID=UPI000D0D7CA3|nr:uncharacterized protein LOC112270533 isoform X1 [Brachypodium distachyon]|eukprot:XP_024313933.1 uncharacterized protein LOC112270533 isoform X1 [Brachypodium distachyon]